MPIIYKDIDALCASRRKYVSDDFPLIGYEATFRRCVNGVLRERKTVPTGSDLIATGTPSKARQN